MKLFETPYIEVLKFAVEDIITVSGGNEEEDEGPLTPTTELQCI